jgi:hypothetical protein
VAYDDVITRRLRTCTLCGRLAPCWMGVWCGKGRMRWLTLAYQMCQACNTPIGAVAVDVKLCQRYEALLEGPS